MVQAGLAAGNDQSTAFVKTWLNAWLQRTAKSWAWPVLKERVIDLPMSSNNTPVGLTGFTTMYIHRIFNPLMYRTSDYKQRGRLFISELLNANVDSDEVTRMTTTSTPSTVKIRQNGNGKFIIYPNCTPDKTYYVTLDIHYIPTNLTLDTEVPWYPSDKTIIQACKCALLEYDDGGEMGAAFEKSNMTLSAMVIDDRDFDGEGPGDNVIMGLDKSVFI